MKMKNNELGIEYTFPNYFINFSNSVMNFQTNLVEDLGN